MKTGNLEVYGIIYKISNKVNGKVYIGQTTNGFKKRYDSTNWWNRTHNEHLRSSVKKYGKENFEVSEVFDVAFSKDELDIKEVCYIDIFRSNNRLYGYNKKEGGARGKHSKESLMKMRVAHLGVKHSEEAKIKMSQFRKGRNLGKDNPMYGKNPFDYMSKDTYEKAIKSRRENRIGQKNPMYGRCGDLNSFYGKRHSLESRITISDKAKERYKDRSRNPGSKRVEVFTTGEDFVENFDSFRSCSEWLLRNNIIKNVRTGDDAIGRSIKNEKPYKGYIFKTVK